ncbi:uncharacterized protein LOC119288718 isoform X3 [Triticum dicoccoides]|uniref:uncharacterized protein LOC119288718 isoform X3 n=1 Tax=Triticum dicoccoides TaxID=85692 RepID=UPI0018907349|nr:uncharacterized protein LOC119288718 isoform X3 [Triticum dicoccoides]XP_037424194.1 uncharacterized protein LOC119288718 isoform X3 [Triticum dicoccoides]XP_037424200.1 uncharacterized protein LOC119288718 isoform X3 [Triticum dicoccoides]
MSAMASSDLLRPDPAPGLKKRTWGAAAALCSALMRMLYCRTVAAMLAKADDNHSRANKGEHSGKEHLAELQEKDAPNLSGVKLRSGRSIFS